MRGARHESTTLITALGAIALLGACATTPTPERKSSHQIDQAYVNTVDHHAARLGAQVYWVNPQVAEEQGFWKPRIAVESYKLDRIHVHVPAHLARKVRLGQLGQSKPG
jgi:hypothetical protein